MDWDWCLKHSLPIRKSFRADWVLLDRSFGSVSHSILLDRISCSLSYDEPHSFSSRSLPLYISLSLVPAMRHGPMGVWHPVNRLHSSIFPDEASLHLQINSSELHLRPFFGQSHLFRIHLLLPHSLPDRSANVILHDKKTFDATL